MIIFSIIYVLFLFVYFITRVGNNKKYRVINKYILASMYLIYAITTFCIKDLPTYHYLLIIALSLAYLGDLLLVFDFKKGGLSLLLANLVFSSFYLIKFTKLTLSFINYFWVFIVLLILIITFVLLINKYPKIIKLDKMKYPMTFYLSSVTLHGLLGLTSLIFVEGISSALMGTGALLFMISDYILTIDRFIIEKNKWIIRSNSLTYFIGMLLIVLSIGL